VTAIIGILGALLVALLVLRLVLRRRLLVKYATLWLLVSCVLLLMTLIPHSLANVADLLGFAVPANLLFLAGFVLLLAIAVQLSVELTNVERRLQRLAEEVALLQEERPTRSERPDLQGEAGSTEGR